MYYQLLLLFLYRNGEYVELANAIGEYYQIRDDYSNLLSETVIYE